MAGFKELTVTFKYIDSDEFKKWFEEQISSRICAVEENKNKLIQVTAWAHYDGLEKLDEAEKRIENYQDDLKYGDDI